MNKYYYNKNSNYKEGPLFFFGIITTDNSSNRQKHIFDFWISKAIQLGYDYVFMTDNKISGDYKYAKIYDSVKSLKTSSYQRSSDINREQKRISVAKYFLEETKASFCFNPTDDVIVDTNKLYQLGIMLTMRFDTEKDIAFLGDCESFDKTIYIQGGTGYLMTRAGAREFLKNAEKWLIEAKHFDDLELEKMFRFMNLSSYDAMSPYFIGHPLVNFSDSNFDLKQIEYCPEYWEPNCGQGIHNFNELIMIHESNISKHKIIKKNYELIQQDTQHRYGFYLKYPAAYLCILNSSINYQSRDPPPLFL